MNKRHEAALQDFIDEFVYKGFAEVSREKLLKCWYGQERMSKKIWLDIESRLPEDALGEDYEVLYWADYIAIFDKTACMTLSARGKVMPEDGPDK